MDLTSVAPKYQIVIPKRVREQFGLCPGQQFQVLALPEPIELVPSQPPAALRGILQGDNTFQREPIMPGCTRWIPIARISTMWN